MLLPEGVEQLIKAFACGWQPTPSASALQKAMKRDTSFVTISDKRAAAMCLSCRMPVRCSREWQIHPDGGVEMVFETHESCCGYDDDSDSEPEYVLIGVCDGLSEKSTWEVGRTLRAKCTTSTAVKTSASMFSSGYRGPSAVVPHKCCRIQ